MSIEATKAQQPTLTPVTVSEVKELAAQCQLHQSDLDEMAVPTYSHANPLARWIFWRRHLKILQLADIHEDSRVLDFGTGIGALLPSLCAASSHVHATDLRDEIARALVQRRRLSVTFHDSRNLEASIPDGFFDTIIAADVLEHIEKPDLSAYLRLFHSKLASGGSLVVSIPTENLLYKCGRLIAGYFQKGDYHRTGIRELQVAAQASGFGKKASAKLPLPSFGCLFQIARYCKERDKGTV